MILKSKSRSNKSFSQLYDYFTKERDTELFSYNLLSNRFDKNEVVREFEKNSDFLHRSLGKNYLYHEILSLGDNDLERELEQEALLELAYRYLELRANNHLVLMAIHKEKNHLHMHMMISANEIYESKRKRLSKKQFATIQAKLESFQNLHFEKLQTFHYQNPSTQQKTSSKEQELSRRGKTSTKEQISKLFNEMLLSSANLQEFKTKMLDNHLELYTRGKTIGIIFEEKKYRLSTLNLSEIYHETLLKWERMNKQDLSQSNELLKAKEFIKNSLEQSQSQKEFIETLYRANFEFYERKSDAEVYINSKWYTLNSLQLARDYQTKKRLWEKNKDFKQRTSFRDKNQKNYGEYQQEL